MQVESKCFESTLKKLLCYFTVLVKMIHAHYKQFRQHQESTKKKVTFQIPPTRTDHGWHVGCGLLFLATPVVPRANRGRLPLFHKWLLTSTRLTR